MKPELPDDLLRRYNLPLREKRVLQELHGVAAMIVYDGVVDDTEIGFLTEWLTRHVEFQAIWPMNELFALLERILADGVIDSDERLQLLRFLTSIGAMPDESGTAAESIFHPQPRIAFPDSSFLFTGTLVMGTRKRAQTAVIERGGIVFDNPRKDLHWLVVGDLGSENWKFSRYGGKIEKVMGHRQNGAKTLIVREIDFVTAVVGHPI